MMHFDWLTYVINHYDKRITHVAIRIGRREVPIHYQSDRINKQIRSLPDILIKLKTEIKLNAVTSLLPIRIVSIL
jgi:SMC interacting uncharacterized protein involved in chromosome segregation